MAFAHAHRATFAGTLVLVMALIPLTLGQPASASASPSSNVQTPTSEFSSIQGSDGFIRTVTTGLSVPIRGAMTARLALAPGDRVVLAADATSAHVIDGNGATLFNIAAPVTTVGHGASRPATLSFDGNVLTATSQVNAVQTRAACPQAWWGSFLVQGVGTAVVCGAAGVATGGIGGAACGIGVHVATSGINWDSACKKRR